MPLSTAYQDGDQLYAGTIPGDPLYGQRQNDPHDVAVLVLDQPITSITPTLLLAAGD